MEAKRVIDLTELDLRRIIREEQKDAEPRPDNWMNSQEAMTYLRMPPGTFYKLTAAGDIPFERDTPRGPMKFKRDELDAWRRK